MWFSEKRRYVHQQEVVHTGHKLKSQQEEGPWEKSQQILKSKEPRGQTTVHDIQRSLTVIAFSTERLLWFLNSMFTQRNLYTPCQPVLWILKAVSHCPSHILICLRALVAKSHQESQQTQWSTAFPQPFWSRKRGASLRVATSTNLWGFYFSHLFSHFKGRCLGKVSFAQITHGLFVPRKYYVFQIFSNAQVSTLHSGT